MRTFRRRFSVAQQAAQRVRFEELGNDRDRRRIAAQDTQPRCFPLGLRVIADGNAKHVPPLDAIGNQHFGLFVRWQERGVARTAAELALPFDGFGKLASRPAAPPPRRKTFAAGSQRTRRGW